MLPDGKDLDARLKQALTEFPNNLLLRKLDLQRKADTPEKPAALTQFVAAQFANLGERGEYRLNDYMASLRHELKESASAAKENGT